MTLLWRFPNTGPRCVVYSANMEAVRERWTDDRMDDLVVRVDNGFAQVDQRFAQIDQRFAQVDQRFAQVDQRFDQIDQRFAQVDQRFAEVHDDLVELRSDQKEIRKELGEKSSRQELSELRAEMTHRFDRLQNMLLTGFFTLVATLVVTQVS